MSILFSFGKPAWPKFENINIGFRIVLGPIGIMVFWMDVDGFLGKVKAWKDKMEENKMFNSKALKSQKSRQYEYDIDKGILGNLPYLFMKYFVWPIGKNYRIFKERSKRAYDFAIFGWNNHDFDMSYVYYLLEFKLKRLQSCLNTGFSVQEPEDTAALEELIQIVVRLGKGSYEDKYTDEHDQKWGEIETRTEPHQYDKKGKVLSYAWISWRKNCPEDVPKKLKEKERKEFSACYGKGESDRVRDIGRMNEILVKNSPRFWD